MSTKTKWRRVRPGLYRLGSFPTRGAAEIERGAEQRASWWWEVIRSDYSSAYGRAVNLRTAMKEAEAARR